MVNQSHFPKRRTVNQRAKYVLCEVVFLFLLETIENRDESKSSNEPQSPPSSERNNLHRDKKKEQKEKS